MPRPLSISEVWGERITRSLVMRMLCGAWLVPAASLIWIGLASTGLRHASEPSQAIALGRTQASAILLAVFTVLIGASVFVRQWAGLPPASRRQADTPEHPGNASWLLVHALSGAAGALAVLAGTMIDGAGLALFPVAAGFGFGAGLALPRALVRHRGSWSSPLVGLGVGISFQLTVGWLHLANPSALLSPALIAEGIILAWVAASAARVDPFAKSLVLDVLPDEPVSTVAAVGVVGSASSVGSVPASPTGFSPAPTQQSIPEAVAGR